MHRLLVLALVLAALPWDMARGQSNECSREVYFYFDITYSVVRYKDNNNRRVGDQLKNVMSSLIKKPEVFRNGHTFSFTTFDERIPAKSQSANSIARETINSSNRNSLADKVETLLDDSSATDNNYPEVLLKIDRDIKNRNDKSFGQEGLIFLFSDFLYDSKSPKPYPMWLSKKKTQEALIALNKTLKKENFRLVCIHQQNNSDEIQDSNYNVKTEIIDQLTSNKIDMISCSVTPGLCDDPQRLVDAITGYILGKLEVVNQSETKFTFNESGCFFDIAIRNRGCDVNNKIKINELILNEPISIGEEKRDLKIDKILTLENKNYKAANKDSIFIENGQTQYFRLTLKNCPEQESVNEYKDSTTTVNSFYLTARLPAGLRQKIRVASANIEFGQPEMQIEKFWVIDDIFNRREYQEIKVFLKPIENHEETDAEYKLTLEVFPPNKDEKCAPIETKITIIPKDLINRNGRTILLPYKEEDCWVTKDQRSPIKYRLTYDGSSNNKWSSTMEETAILFQISPITIFIICSIAGAAIVVALFVLNQHHRNKILEQNKSLAHERV